MTKKKVIQKILRGKMGLGAYEFIFFKLATKRLVRLCIHPLLAPSGKSRFDSFSCFPL